MIMKQEGKKRAIRRKEKSSSGSIFRWLIGKPFLYIFAFFVVASVVYYCMIPAVTESGTGDGGVDFSDNIINVYIMQQDPWTGVWKTVGSFDTLTPGDSIKIHIDYSLEKNSLDASRRIFYQIPSAIGGYTGDLSGDVIDQITGNKIGEYTISETGLIEIIFNEEAAAQNVSSGISGYIEFEGQLSNDFTGKEDGSASIIFGEQEVIFKVPDSATTSSSYGIRASKGHSNYDPINNTIDYSINVWVPDGKEGSGADISIADSLSSSGMEYVGSSFQVIDNNGNSVENVQLTVSFDGFSMILPEINGTSSYYTITYRVQLSDIPEGYSTYSFNNSVTADNTASDDEHSIPEYSTSDSFVVYAPGEDASKSGTFDACTSTTKWTIILNRSYSNVKGYTLYDVMTENGVEVANMEIVGDVSITKTSASGISTTTTISSDNFEFPYTLCEEDDYSTYTIVYTTKNDVDYNNSKEIKNYFTLYDSNGQTVAKKDGTVNANRNVLEKGYDWNIVDNSDGTKTMTWNVSISNTNIKTGDKIVETFGHADENAGTGDVWAKDDMVNIQISKRYDQSNILSSDYYKLDYIYDSDDSEKIIGFEIIFLNDVPENIMPLNISYKTFIDVSEMNTGEKRKFENGVKYIDTDDKSAEVGSSYEYTEQSRLSKTALGGSSVSLDDFLKNNDTSINDGYYIDWQITFRADSGWNGDISILDEIDARLDTPQIISVGNATTYNDFDEEIKNQVTYNTETKSFIIPESVYKKESPYNIYITYRTFIKNPEEVYTAGSSFKIDNQVSADISDIHVSADCTKEIKPNTVFKGEPVVNREDGEFKYTVSYSVDINKYRADLVQNESGKLVVQDILTYNNDNVTGVNLDRTTFKLYEVKEDGSKLELSSEKFTIAISTEHGNYQDKNIITLTIPDEMYVVMEYDYIIEGKNNAKVQFVNIVQLSGVNDGVDKDAKQLTELQLTSSSAGASTGSVIFLKVDADNALAFIEGAKFRLYKYAPGDDAASADGWVELYKDPSDTSICYVSTDNVNGFVINALEGYQAYKLVEVDAPDGYDFADDYMFYIITPNGKTDNLSNPDYFPQDEVQNFVALKPSSQVDILEPKLETVVFNKNDADSLEPLPGAVFELAYLSKAPNAIDNFIYYSEHVWENNTNKFYYDLEWNVVGQYTSNEAGKIVLNTSVAEDRLYRLIEIQAPSGYSLDADPYYFYIGNTEKITLLDAYLGCNFIGMYDLAGKGVTNDTKFILKAPDLVEVGESVTNNKTFENAETKLEVIKEWSGGVASYYPEYIEVQLYSTTEEPQIVIPPTPEEADTNPEDNISLSFITAPDLTCGFEYKIDKIIYDTNNIIKFEMSIKEKTDVMPIDETGFVITGGTLRITGKDTGVVNSAGYPIYEYTIKIISVDPGNSITIYPSHGTDSEIYYYYYLNSYSETVSVADPKPSEMTPVGEPVQIRSDGGTFSYVWTKLPEIDNDGKKLFYYILEKPIEQYTASYENNWIALDNQNPIISITNTYEGGDIEEIKDTLSFTVHKAWKDKDGNTTTPNDNVEVELQLWKITVPYGENVSEAVNGIKVGDSVKIDNNSEWLYTWSNLEKHNEEKTESYFYYATETSVIEKGTAGLDDTDITDEYIITNTGVTNSTSTFTIYNQEKPKCSLTVKKVWVGDDESLDRPTSIIVKLLRNGLEYRTQEISATDNWTYTWTDLPAKDEYGTDYSYEVSEESIPGYTASYSNSAGDTTSEVLNFGEIKTDEYNNQYFEFNDVGLQFVKDHADDPSAVIRIIYSDSKVDKTDWNNLGIGTSADNVWKQMSYNNPPGDCLTFDINIKDYIASATQYGQNSDIISVGINDISSISYITVQGYNGCIISSVKLVYTTEVLDTGNVITITNTKISEDSNPSYELPATGGSGTNRYLMAGIALLLLAGLGYIMLHFNNTLAISHSAEAHSKMKERNKV